MTHSYTLLLLGDLHFGTFSGYTRLGAPLSKNSQSNEDRDIVNDLIDATSNSGRTVDTILVPGDLTSIASPSEFIGCRAIVEEISTSLQTKTSEILYTFGNHDANIKIAELADKENDPYYTMIAGYIGDAYIKQPTDFQEGPIPGSGILRQEKAEHIVLNTGFACTGDQTIPHGKLGNEQLQWLKSVLAQQRPENKWRIVSMHHHPENSAYPTPVHDISSIEEGAELIAAIGTGQVDLVSRPSPPPST